MTVPTPPKWAETMTTVGVTGTNGKTTTTAWVAAALRAGVQGPVVRATTVGFFIDDRRVTVEKSYDGFLGCLKEAHDLGGHYAAIELTSEALARGFARAWPCQVGVFTNLTHDHLDAHGSPEHYLASKAQLFVALPPGGTAVLNASDENFALLAEVVPAHAKLRTYAVPSRGEVVGTPEIVATNVAVTWEGTRITCVSETLPTSLSVKAIGAVYAENALAALLGAVAAGVGPEVAAKAIAEAEVPPGRFEVIHDSPHVVIDYAHSPDALARTVAIARALAPAKLYVVFGAGGARDKAKRGPMGAAARAADTIILTSDNPRNESPADIAAAIEQGLAGHRDVRTILDRRCAIETALMLAGPNDVVLIAGKGHETEQVIGSETRHFSDAGVARAFLRR